jgi:hypothetical protein
MSANHMGCAMVRVAPSLLTQHLLQVWLFWCMHFCAPTYNSVPSVNGRAAYASCASSTQCGMGRQERAVKEYSPAFTCKHCNALHCRP